MDRRPPPPWKRPSPCQSTSLKAAEEKDWEDGDYNPLVEAVSGAR